MIAGLTLQSTQEEIYRALLEAIAFGNRRIMDNFTEHGIELNEIVACGGIAERSPLIMQLLADTSGRPVHVPALDRGAGARVGAVRCGRRRGVRGHRLRDRRDAAGNGADLHAGSDSASPSTTRSTPSTGSVYETLGRTQVELLHGLKRIRTNQRRAP